MSDVKWDVNVNVESSSAKAASGHVDKLAVGLGKADAGAAKATGAFGKFSRMLLLNAEGFKGIGAAAGEAHAKTSEFLEFFGAEAALEVLKGIAEKIVDIGEEAVKSAAKAERMNRVFSIQQGGKAQGKAAQEWVEKFSKTSEFTEAENESAFVNLRKHGVGSEQTGLIMKAAADVAAGSEDRAGAYQEAIGAFTRLQSTGRVQARTLMPLGIGIEDFKKMPEFKGMTNEKVNAALAKKNVNQNELFQLIMAHSGETKIGSRSADNVDLLGTKMEKLQELPERFFKKLGDTKAVGQLAHALDGALTKLDPDSPAGAKIFGGLESALTAVADAAGTIDFDELASGIGKVASDVGPAIELFKELGHDVGVVFENLGKVNDALHDFTPLGYIEDKLTERMSKRAGLGAPGVTDRMKGFDYAAAKAQLHAMGGAKAAMEGPVYDASAYGTGKAIPAGLAAGVRSKADLAADAAGDVADAMVDTVKKKHKTHSPSEVFADIGEMDIAGYVGGVSGGRGAVSRAVATTFEVPSGGARTAAGGAAGGINVTLQTTIHVDGGKDGAEQGRRAANAYDAKIRATLTSIIEQANASGGG